MISNDEIYDICIVGLGPAGIGAALTILKHNSKIKVICIDAGASHIVRSCAVLNDEICRGENPCNIISGFGGCSLLSSGKVSDYPAGSALASILKSEFLAKQNMAKALELFGSYVKLHKSSEVIENIEQATNYYKQLGFDFKYYDVYHFDEEDLKKSYENIYLQLRAAGIQVQLNTKLEHINKDQDGFALEINSNMNKRLIKSKKVILGLGRLGEKFIEELNENMHLGGKQSYFDIGVRLEYPTYLFPDLTKYHLDLKLKFNDARTYCISPNGKVALYNYRECLFTEGYSNYRQTTEYTNLAILQRLPPSGSNKDIFDELTTNYAHINNRRPIVQNLVDYLGIKGVPSECLTNHSLPYAKYSNINELFPSDISVSINKSVNYFVSRMLPSEHYSKMNVFAPEIDYVNTRIPVNSDFSVLQDLYIIGSNTGQFRGILQAFCSGLICGESIMEDIYEKE